MSKIKNKAKNKILDNLADKNVSVKELSIRVGVTDKTIYNIIKRKNDPKISLANKIAKFFGRNVDEMFEFEEE